MGKSNNAGDLLLRSLSLNQHGRKGVNLKQIKQRVVFILSTGRTGTKFLADFLDRQPGVYAVHEPKPSRRLRLYSMAYLQGELDDSTMAEVLWRYRSGLLSNIKEGTYVESNNFLAGFANAIKQTFKNPVLIHVVRDPRTYITSAINHGADSGLKGAANRYFPYANLKPGFIKRASGGHKDKILARTALNWKLVNECLEQAGANYPHYYRFKFEDLFGDDTKDLETIIKLAGVRSYSAKDLKAKSQPANVSRLRVMPNWPDWSREQARAVNDICGPLMRHYHYGTENKWQQLLKP